MRWLKRAEWEIAKRVTGRERTVSGLPTGLHDIVGTGADHAEVKRVSDLSQRELGCLSDAAHRLKSCTLCGEKYSPGEARSEPTGCSFHPDDFAPEDPRGWSRSELKQLRLYAKQALKSAGGASWVQRHPRASRGRGHWLKGLGMLASDKVRFRQCLEGDVAARWACCGGEGLFTSGCQRGVHRHF
jgi:hypothetical protein